MENWGKYSFHLYGTQICAFCSDAVYASWHINTYVYYVIAVILHQWIIAQRLTVSLRDTTAIATHPLCGMGVAGFTSERPGMNHCISWWRHQMGTVFALLALCAGNSPVTGEFPTQRPVTRSFDVFFDLRLDKQLSKQSWGWWFETPSRSLWRQSNVNSHIAIIITIVIEISEDSGCRHSNADAPFMMKQPRRITFPFRNSRICDVAMDTTLSTLVAICVGIHWVPTNSHWKGQ